MSENGFLCAVVGVCIRVKFRRRPPWRSPGDPALFFLKNIPVRIVIFVETCHLELKIRILTPKWLEMAGYGFRCAPCVCARGSYLGGESPGTSGGYGGGVWDRIGACRIIFWIMF